MLDNQQQYFRRLCMVVSKMEASGDEVSNSEDAEDVLSVLATESRIDRNIIVNNINKVDPTGATLDTKQQHIVKFKTNSFKKYIYIWPQKDRKKCDKCRCLGKFKLSVTWRTIKLLSNATNKIKDNDSVKFVYADTHGALKIVLQNLLNFKYIYSFNIETELDKILSKLDLQYQESRESDVEK